MRIRRWATPMFVAAFLAVLSGCTATPAPSASTAVPSSPPASTSTSPTATPGPAVVKPAKTAADAIHDANASLVGYFTATFQDGHEGGTRLDLVTPWTTGAALANERTLAAYLQQKHYRLDGVPTGWSLNTSRSSTISTKVADGVANPFGGVRLVGCAQSTNRPVGDGAPAWTTENKQFARAWTVLYDSTRHRWLVAAAAPLTDAESKAAACP